MKKIKKFFPSFLVLSAAAFFFYHLVEGIFFSKIKKSPPLLHIQSITVEEKPFVILLSAYNSGRYLERNVHSILNQDYKNFRVIYIDDSSNDGSAQRAKEIIQMCPIKERITYIQNDFPKGEIENIYAAIQKCKSNEIILLLRGKDWLAHDDALTCLNRCYANDSIWMTYGSYCTYPTYNHGKYNKSIDKKILSSASLRKYSKKHVIGWHLISGYASLFKKIKSEDLKKEGKFFSAAVDKAFAIPLIEMAMDHSYYVHDVLYIQNRFGYKEEENLDREFQFYIQSLAPYPPLESISFSS